MSRGGDENGTLTKQSFRSSFVSSGLDSAKDDRVVPLPDTVQLPCWQALPLSKIVGTIVPAESVFLM